MQAINHAAFGSLIAVTFTEPILAVPLALGSHFLMDAIPHYGNDPRAPRGSKFYYAKILADTLATIVILIFFISLHPVSTTLIIVCAVVAIMPDFLWPLALHIKQKGPLWSFFRFHKLIQRESRSGIFIELVWLTATTLIVVYRIRYT